MQTTQLGPEPSHGCGIPPSFQTVPEWTLFLWLRAGFSARHGGLSTAYGPGQQNLGWTVEEDPSIVAGNRRAFVAAIAAGAAPSLVTLQQTHGNTIRDMDGEAPPLMTPEGKAILHGDGLMTAQPGRLLGVITADCVPVLVADTRRRAVAAFHAGWRGTLAGIVEQGIGRMRERYGSAPEDLVAAVGPAIGPCCFAVGDEVRGRFEERYGYAAELFSAIGSETHMDLPLANRRQLLEAGVPADKISIVGGCTACTRLADGRRMYFSHRAERGITGRMLSVVGVV